MQPPLLTSLTHTRLFSFFMPPPAEIKFEDAVGILRLAHKYDVPYLRRRALQHVAGVYPTTLPEYDGRPPSELEDDAEILRCAVVIEAATEVDALWLLPVAYYRICTHDLSTIIEHPQWSALGEKERKACLVGHSEQIRQFSTLFQFLNVAKEKGDDCDDWAYCNIYRLKLNFILSDSMRQSMAWPLDYWGAPDLWENLALCENCLKEAKALHATARQTLWEQLPEMYGLPDWNHLEGMRRAALSV